MSITDFRANLNAAVRGIWQGVLTPDQFFSAFGGAIQRGITQAWYEGAASCGITPEELTQEERTQLSRFILLQRMYMGRFMDYVVSVRAALPADQRPKIPPSSVMSARLGIWVNRYNEARELGASFACANQKMVWRLGATKVHCKSCLGFNGRTYRYETWRGNGALPQSRRLECKGYYCDCRLETTEDRVTPGRFPRRLLA